MLRFETLREGFAVTLNGRQILAHSPASPCVFVSTQPLIAWIESSRGGRWVRRPLRRTHPLRGYTIVEAGDECVVLNFENRVRLEIVYDRGCARVVPVAKTAPAALRIELSSQAGDAVFGGGADSGPESDLSGSRIEAWGSDIRDYGLSGVIRGGARGREWPIMSFVTSSHRWVRVAGSGWMSADFRDRQRLAFEFSVMPRAIFVGFEHSATATLAALAKKSGSAIVPPAWTRSGAILSLSGAPADMARRLELALGSGLRLAGVRLSDLDLLAKEGQDPASLAVPRAKGLKTLAVARPYFERDGRARREAQEAGFILKTVAEPGVLDLEKQDAVVWMAARIAEAMATGDIEGLRLDHRVNLPGGGEGRRPEALASRWPVLWSKIVREACQARLAGGNGLLLSSARGWGMEDSMHALSLPALVPDVFLLPGRVAAFLSHGLSGGGFCWLDASTDHSPRRRPSPKSPQAWLARRRAIELAAFGPVLEFSVEDSDLRDPTRLRFLARMSAIFADLAPYHEAVAADYLQSAFPPIRHAFLHYPDFHISGPRPKQFLYGRDLLVAVAADPGDFVDLELPTDDWVHLWSSREFRGGKVSIEASSGHPAVFYRAGSPLASLFDGIRRAVRRM